MTRIVCVCGEQVPCPAVGGPDIVCDVCKRVWYATGDAEAPCATRRRKVRLLKMPQEGDRMEDVVQPVPIGKCPKCGTPVYTAEGFCGVCGR